MTTIVQILISTVLSASVLWLSIKIVERYNDVNRFPTAVVIGLIFSVFGSFCIGPFMVLPLVALLFLLLRFYDLGLLKSLLVVLLMGGMNFLLGLVISSILVFLNLV